MASNQDVLTLSDILKQSAEALSQRGFIVVAEYFQRTSAEIAALADTALSRAELARAIWQNLDTLGQSALDGLRNVPANLDAATLATVESYRTALAQSESFATTAAQTRSLADNLHAFG